MDKKKVFVTGASGLVGTHLVYQLAQQGYAVKALLRNLSSLNTVREVFGYYTKDPSALIEKIEWTEGDVLDYYGLCDIMDDVKHVYHTAALVSFQSSDKEQMMATNIRGTANVVNACLESGVEKLCHVSSVAALGHRDDGMPVDEQTPWKYDSMVSAYAISKFFAETEVWRGIEEGLTAVIVNPTVVMGPGNWQRGSSSIMTAIYHGLCFYPSGSTGYVDVRDVVNVMIALTESPVCNEKFILNSENLSYKTTFEMMSTALGLKTRWKEAPSFLLSLGCALDTIRSFIFRTSPRLTRELILAGQAHVAYSNKKITETCGWHFIPIQESIAHMAQCFLTNPPSLL